MKLKKEIDCAREENLESLAKISEKNIIDLVSDGDCDSDDEEDVDERKYKVDYTRVKGVEDVAFSDEDDEDLFTYESPDEKYLKRKNKEMEQMFEL